MRYFRFILTEGDFWKRIVLCCTFAAANRLQRFCIINSIHPLIKKDVRTKHFKKQQQVLKDLRQVLSPRGVQADDGYR